MALLSWIVFTVTIGLITPPPHSCWREMNATHQSIERVGLSTSTSRSLTKQLNKREIVTLPNLDKSKKLIDQGKNLLLNKTTNPIVKTVLNSTVNRLINTTTTMKSTTRKRKTTTTTTRPTTTSIRNNDDGEDDDIDEEEDDSINDMPSTVSKSNKKPSDTNQLYHVNKPQKTIGNPIEITLTNLSLVKPLASPVLYEQKDVRNVFMVFLLLIIIGEFFSAPAITLAVRHCSRCSSFIRVIQLFRMLVH